MHWKQLDKENPPPGEVLAKDGNGNMVVGTVYVYFSGNTVCSDGETEVNNVTHYILAETLLKLHNELRP